MSSTPARTRDKLRRPDCEIHFEVTGSGPAVVFAHGLGGNHMSWWQQIPEFAQRYTCVAFAHRGFAPSTAPADGVDPNSYADDLAALLDHLKLDQVHIVAQSMGGWTATAFALRWPERVKALVMACTTGVFDFRRSKHPALAGIEAAAAEAERTAREWFMAGIHPACGARMAREQPLAHFLYREIDDLSHRLDKESLRRKLFAMRSRAPEEAAALRFPTLFISGEEDVAIPTAGVVAIGAAFPNARVERVKDTGHSVYFERPALFNRLVGEFLATAG